MVKEPAAGQLKEKDHPPSNDQLQRVKEVVSKFFLAVKNHSLYPEHHAMSKAAIADFKTDLGQFFERFGNLRIDVEKERLVFQGETIHQGPPDPENTAFILYRDGVQWLAFQEGIESGEILEFIRILDHYRSQKEEAEGDIVTALWEAEFSYLNYGTNEVLWEDDGLIDFSRLKVMEEERLGLERHFDAQADTPSIADPELDQRLWKLTPDEIKETLNLVFEEENRDFDTDLLDVLLVILRTQQEEADLAVVLDFIRESFQNTIAKAAFAAAFRFLKKMNEIYHAYRAEKFWALPLFEDFFVLISSAQVLSALQEAFPKLTGNDPRQLREFRETLLLLSPQAILALGPMLLQVRSSAIQRQLMEVIGSLAIRDLRPLIRLLDHPETDLVQKAVYILGHIEGENATAALIKMTHAASSDVRLTAVKALIRRGLPSVEELFPLIEDVSGQIRRLLLDHMGQKQNKEVEALLLDYLDRQTFSRKTHQHLLAVYRTLGRCGSSRSIPFLQEMLFSRTWMPGFGKSLHREGAALALSELKHQEARQLLNKAAKSLFPSVRNAYQRAMEEKNE